MHTLSEMLVLAIQFPYVEMDKFTKKWKRGQEEKTEKDMRYNLYCCYVFNYLAELFEDSWERLKREGRGKKSTPLIGVVLMQQIYYPEMLDTHKAWWMAGGCLGYTDAFQAFVNSYYDGMTPVDPCPAPAPKKPKTEKPAKAPAKAKASPAKKGKK